MAARPGRVRRPPGFFGPGDFRDGSDSVWAENLQFFSGQTAVEARSSGSPAKAPARRHYSGGDTKAPARRGASSDGSAKADPARRGTSSSDGNAEAAPPRQSISPDCQKAKKLPRALRALADSLRPGLRDAAPSTVARAAAPRRATPPEPPELAALSGEGAVGERNEARRRSSALYAPGSGARDPAPSPAAKPPAAARPSAPSPAAKPAAAKRPPGVKPVTKPAAARPPAAKPTAAKRPPLRSTVPAAVSRKRPRQAADDAAGGSDATVPRYPTEIWGVPVASMAPTASEAAGAPSSKRPRTVGDEDTFARRQLRPHAESDSSGFFETEAQLARRRPCFDDTPPRGIEPPAASVSPLRDRALYIVNPHWPS